MEERNYFVKNSSSSEEGKRELKPKWEIIFQTKVNKLWQQAKMLKQVKNTIIYSDEQRKEPSSDEKIQIKEINLKVITKEGRLKYSETGPNSTYTTGHSKKKKKNLPASKVGVGEDIPRIEWAGGIFGPKYGNREIITKKPNGETAWKKSCKYSKKGLVWKYNSIY